MQTPIVAGLLAGISAIIFRGIALCWSSGRWDHWPFWLYAGLYGLVSGVGAAMLDPGLRKERMTPGPGGKDRGIIPLIKFLFLSHLILAGLDVGRYHWSDTVPFQLSMAAFVVFTIGIVLSECAMIINRFFSPVVRIQKERDHQLITGGAYRLMRHPGYAGIILALIASPFALNSWVSSIPMVLLGIVVIRRTWLEDRFLQEELDGYRDYAKQVRYRLFPFVW